MKLVPWLSFLAVVLLPSSFHAAETAAPKDQRLAVLDALKQELVRSREKLKLPGEDPPYFIRYLVREYDDYDLSARFGSLLEDSYQNVRQANVEVRVGDYHFDNTADDSTEKMFDLDDLDRYDPPVVAPLDNDLDALRATMWLQTDAQYKKALSLLHKKRGNRVTRVVEDESVGSFSKEKTERAVDKPIALKLDRTAWDDRLRRVSAVFKAYPEVFDSQAKLSVNHQTRYIVTTEGTELISERLIYGLHLNAAGRAPDGLLVQHFRSFYGATENELPDEKTLFAAAQQLSKDVIRLRQAPMMDPFNGPAILLPEAAGVFFHEALGHRLEGERQNDNKEGATFKGQIGKPILPTFLTILDDPSLAKVGKASLNGRYAFDDEGVAARRVALVDHGVLRNYLKSRTPVKGAPQSNGHGRSEGTLDPIGRMGNTIVESDRRVPYAKLKEMLLEEVRRQKKAFGLIIADISGGQTNTTTYDFQAFKGMPRIVYRVDAKTGKEELVRGVEFVGTPIGSLNRIVAASDSPGVFNGFCGAESGFVPVSTVAPAVLISEIELQRTRRAMERPPILPAPWR
ncbi:MAG TPA: metallopeptidase TldD-related protein [Polyangia bacterium]|nr:metallopeptidase TldD-related protein [Polyangia bacterium]